MQGRLCVGDQTGARAETRIRVSGDVERRGTSKAIPQMVMAAASLDDIAVIVVNAALLGLLLTRSTTIKSFIDVSQVTRFALTPLVAAARFSFRCLH